MGRRRRRFWGSFWDLYPVLKGKFSTGPVQGIPYVFGPIRNRVSKPIEIYRLGGTKLAERRVLGDSFFSGFDAPVP